MGCTASAALEKPSPSPPAGGKRKISGSKPVSHKLDVKGITASTVDVAIEASTTNNGRIVQEDRERITEKGPIQGSVSIATLIN
jgi:hypothetical protein